MKKFRSILALLTAGAILACSACGETTKTSSHYRLVKSVTKYSFNQQTEEWEPSERTDYAYKNGYPTSIASTIIYEDSEEPGLCYTFQYTFDDNGQPVSAKFSDGTMEKTVEYNKGRVWKRTDVVKGQSKREEFYQYGNSDGYFTLLVSTYNTFIDPMTMEEVDSIDVTKNGELLKKTVNTGMYANWNDGETKEWQRFNGTYTANYDSDGIIHDTTAVFRAGSFSGEDHIKVTKNKGRVSEVETSVYYPDNNTTMISDKYVIEYTDIEIDAARYANMINDIVLGQGNNFYKYFWY